MIPGDSRDHCQDTRIQGRDYTGTAAVAVTGETCIKWTDIWTYYGWHFVGDHNYCRTPVRAAHREYDLAKAAVWCHVEGDGIAGSNWEYCEVQACGSGQVHPDSCNVSCRLSSKTCTPGQPLLRPWCLMSL